jgi:hypothetical protein
LGWVEYKIKGGVLQGNSVTGYGSDFLSQGVEEARREIGEVNLDPKSFSVTQMLLYDEL